MQRYFISDSKENIENTLQITGEDVHHISRVMRMKESDQLVCVVSGGEQALCEIAEITNDSVKCRVIQWTEISRELPVRIAVANGLPKGDKLEYIIQKGTELGAHMFVPFNAARSVVKLDQKKAAKKVERWKKIAKEAAEQSYRNKIPEIMEPMTFQELMKLSEGFHKRIVAYEESAKQGEKKNFSRILESLNPEESLLIAIGPEGGFSEKEISQLTENNFELCSFGPRILRTETASLYALSAISYYFELSR
ncbi:16S rRNA (uracil(1498)-N(3))-methyltransferase [Bacillus lacus]|uniref:Ribosomal RNA small subunit methyltransferase E n=1 Tax=Metabacillus lacus TaxID=1983721 RepID=A0A7X2LYW1_9BACI|nr:16S rRNA (uracil(1498)-N(3))-methyltransferase [Metabacillus lacus]MRX71317.1 16S rRNA (uracil(1498)-N(3))-methyltransferase [Metabacillus lacus]